MSVFTGYRSSVGQSCYGEWHEDEPERNVVLVAATRSEALGFLLEAFPSSAAEDWAITEIDTETAGIKEGLA